MGYGDTDDGMGRRLRSRREALGLTRGVLVRRLGMSAKQLEDYEAGRVRPNAGMLFKLSRELNVPISYFFANGDDHGGSADIADNASPAPRNGEGPPTAPSGVYLGFDGNSRDAGARDMRAFGSPSAPGQNMPDGHEALGAGEIATLLRAYRVLPAALRATVRELALRLARQARGLGFNDESRR